MPKLIHLVTISLTSTSINVANSLDVANSAILITLSALEKASSVFALSPNDGWCDDPAHEDYNKPIKLPHAGSHERLWRDDNIYDIVVALGYNTSPVIPFMGSAIFIHFAEPSFKSTRGCIALKDFDLLEILKTCSTETNLHVMEF